MKITFNQQNYIIEKPMTLKEIIIKYQLNQEIYGGIVNGKIRELDYIINDNATIEWIDAKSETGRLIYERTLTFLFIVAVKKIYPNAKVKIEHTFCNGLYCTINHGSYLTYQDVTVIKEKMEELVLNKAKITRTKMPKQQAIQFFKENNLEDKADLLSYRDKEICSVYTLENISDYFYGFMLPDVSYIKNISLEFYSPGVRLGQFDVELKTSKLFDIMQEYERWGELIKVPTVAKLNQKIADGKINELMLMSEAMIEKKLAELASNIIKKNPKVKMILIAGPSSAGKTTFSKRLSIHLKILGKEPITISMDDFYLNREDTPKLPDGRFDFEGINAVDLKLFNETMLKLINGEKTKLPTFNFKTGKREYNHDSIQLTQNQILIIEGIHGLNPKSSFYIPKDEKVKIYINALTHLNYDDHNRISTSDYRLIRRIVRDHQFRNITAKKTIDHWKNVKNGEDLNIYPYQEEADYIFNTSMVYEMSVLKPIAQQLLSEINIDEKEYIEANRLNKLLNYFVESKVNVPQDSILAEFVGNSIFE